MYLENDQARIHQRMQYILELFPRLAERRGQMAGTMSGGEQRMLEIGRALMLEPKIVMMDEPRAGLSPLITRMIFDNIQYLNREIGLTVLMIEQNARQGLEVSHRGLCTGIGPQRLYRSRPGLAGQPRCTSCLLGRPLRQGRQKPVCGMVNLTGTAQALAALYCWGVRCRSTVHSAAHVWRIVARRPKEVRIKASRFRPPAGCGVWLSA